MSEKNRELISVIIPVYNSAKSLDSCLQSVLNQTYNNIEIILIDDGSKDNSGEICDDYSKKYNYIKTHHVVNGGPSKARNMGINYAKGEYIIFIDSDDYIANNMLEILYNNMKNYEADISMCSITNVDTNGKIIKDNTDYESKVMVLNQKEFRGNIEDPKLYFTYATNKLIKKAVVGKTRFREDIFYNEDGLFYFDLSKNIKKAVFDGRNRLYFYVIHENSANGQIFNDRYLTVLDSFREIEQYENDFNEKNFNFYANQYIIYMNRALYYLKKKKKVSVSFIREYKRIKKKYYKAALFNKDNSLKEKIKLFFMTNCNSFYFSVKKIIKKIKNKG